MIRRLASVVGIFFLSVVPLLAQGGGTSEFNGSVVDQSGGALPGVTITVTEESTGLVRTVVSNDVGRFVLPAMVPGRYTMRAELAGFQTQTRTGTVLAVGQAITINYTLPVGTLQDQVTVTGESPLVEVTQTEIGTQITANDIESMPLQGREQYALLQLVPGLTPALTGGSFEGAAFNANGRDTGSNWFLVDGQSNKDDRTMTQPQARVTVDSMAEFQVLTHEYGAEYGGSAGVIINAVTKSGTNEFHGRAFYFYQDESLNATNYFVKLAGEKNTPSGSKTGGANIGGPIVRNKAFFFFNYENTKLNTALNLNFPPEAAPLAVTFQDNYKVNLTNYLTRLDYQLTPNNLINFRIVYGPNDGIGENAETELTTPEGFRYERAPGETLMSGQWTAVIGNNKVNEFKVGTTREDLWIGDRRIFNADFNSIPFDIKTRAWVGLQQAGVADELDFGSKNQHPDYAAGPRDAMSGAKLAINSISDQFTYTPSSHALRVGFGFSQNEGTNILAGNQIGTFDFNGNAPFNQANPSTYPIRFRIRVGELFIPINDKRSHFYVSDKWQAMDKLTVNLGVRYEYSQMTPNSKDAFAPRLGVVYAPNPRTAIRAAFGKFYELPSTAVLSALDQGRVISTVNIFDTGEDLSAMRGVLPTHPCLQAQQGRPGLAVINAACRALLVTTRNQLAAGQFVNTEPLLPGNRKLGFIYQYNVGFEQQILPSTALTVDFVSSRGRDQTARLDINEPRLLPNGTIGRPGVAVFDADGTRIPTQARGATFQRVLEYTTSDLFQNDYDALEMSVDKRFANRWSGRLSYTVSRAHDVQAGNTGGSGFTDKRVNDDLNPRVDYGLANFNNTHSVALGGNWNAWRGLGIGGIFRYYSGNPINEVVGTDVNRDRDNTDRPIKGLNDATLPIQSAVDANGQAIRNGLDGPSKKLMDLRVQYVHNLGAQRTVGFFLELYNALDTVNYARPTGSRQSANFLKFITADDPRSAQLGFRFTY